MLAGTKLIAEAWDAAGLYQVGSFIGDTWQEWNGRFRDDVRRFWKGDDRTVPALAKRLQGSPDIYGHEEREAEQSINFVTCHDGFTLNDLVSHDGSTTRRTGRTTTTGRTSNLSWNCGVEGPTDDPAVQALRNRQVKNFLTVLMLAVGVPMLLMGDECRRGQGGNNNGYTLDGEGSWLDWALLAQHAGLHRFVKGLAAFRQRQDVVDTSSAVHAQSAAPVGTRRLARRGARPARLERAVAFPRIHRAHPAWAFVIHAMFNAYWEPLTFELPRGGDGIYRWRRLVDTALAPPDDICVLADAPHVTGGAYRVEPRSSVLLVSPLRARPPGRQA